MNIAQTYQTHQERYFAWIYERQLIWYRRYMLRAPRPWSDDPILDRYRFTNAYRELDRGTLYAKQHVINPRSGDSIENLMMRAITYRVFNKVSTYDKVFREVGYFDYPGYVPDWDEIHRLLVVEWGKGPIFTNAHVVATFGARKDSGETKVSRVVKFLDTTHQMISIICDKVLVQPGIYFSKAHRQLMDLENIGDFTAYEILSDLAYTNVVEFTEDTWANAGPGAMEGLKLIFPGQVGKRLAMDLMIELQDGQNMWLQSLGLPLWLVAGPKVHSARLTLRNIEGGLCEYYKYDACVKGRTRQTYSLGEGYAWSNST